jgi:hypothetical protein
MILRASAAVAPVGAGTEGGMEGARVLKVNATVQNHSYAFKRRAHRAVSNRASGDGR